MNIFAARVEFIQDHVQDCVFFLFEYSVIPLSYMKDRNVSPMYVVVHFY